MNEPLISFPFLSSKLDSPVIKTLEGHMKKSVTDQMFILKEITS